MLFTTGFFLGLSLIIAIGAQNAFILRQGLLKQHVFILCFLCAVCDALLIAAGVAGLGVLIEKSHVLLTSIRLGGAAFLIWYAFGAFRRAMNPQSMEELVTTTAGDLRTAVLTCLAFTFLNPHVYLDTVLLVGGLSTQFESSLRIVYAAGAMIASFVWFFALGYGARLLVPIFQNKKSWQVLDVLIGIVMLLIAGTLLSSFLY